MMQQIPCPPGGLPPCFPRRGRPSPGISAPLPLLPPNTGCNDAKRQSSREKGLTPLAKKGTPEGRSSALSPTQSRMTSLPSRPTALSLHPQPPLPDRPPPTTSIGLLSDFGLPPFDLATASSQTTVNRICLIDQVPSDAEIERREQELKAVLNKEMWDERSERRARFIAHCLKEGMAIIWTKGDGNCFFYALSFALYGTRRYHLCLRLICVDFMRRHPDIFKDRIESEEGMSFLACLKVCS